MAAKLKEGERVRRQWGSRDKGTVTFAYGMGRVRVHWDTPNADGTPNVTVMQTRMLDRVDPDAVPTLDDTVTAAPVADDVTSFATCQRPARYGFNADDVFKRPRLGAHMDAVRSKVFARLCTAIQNNNKMRAYDMADIMFTIDNGGADQLDPQFDDRARATYRNALYATAHKSIREQYPDWMPS